VGLEGGRPSRKFFHVIKKGLPPHLLLLLSLSLVVLLLTPWRALLGFIVPWVRGDDLVFAGV
jgi:hypothetical protein